MMSRRPSWMALQGSEGYSCWQPVLPYTPGPQGSRPQKLLAACMTSLLHTTKNVKIVPSLTICKTVASSRVGSHDGTTSTPPVLILHFAQLGVGGFHHCQGSTGVLHLLQWAQSPAQALAMQGSVAVCEQWCRAMQSLVNEQSHVEVLPSLAAEQAVDNISMLLRCPA